MPFMDVSISMLVMFSTVNSIPRCGGCECRSTSPGASVTKCYGLLAVSVRGWVIFSPIPLLLGSVAWVCA
jgi:hypothetical protein